MFDYPLTIVEAPIGYGKTTAVREFLAAKGVPVIWTSFFSENDTPEAFWGRLAAEVGKLDETAGNRLKSLGAPADAPQIAAILTILNDLDYEKNTTLVVDDFHLAKGMRVTGLIRRFVLEMPEDFHAVFITRDMSPLDISELTAKGLCNILPQQTLRFTAGEIQDYCALMGFRPSEDDLKKIALYTGGWISLVYLILLGLERGIPVGRNSAIDELVERNLYNAYDQSIRQFLLRLSVMDTFTAEQARYVTQESSADELLRKLRRENAFISYDEAAGVYKIHNVLLDFLRARQGDSEERRALYRHVGEWYLERKAYMQAYGYLFRAGETERILALLDNEDTITNDASDFEGAYAMFAAAPRELLFKYPLAYLQYIASLLLLSGDPDLAVDAAGRLDELHAVYECDEGLHPARRNRVLAEISTIRIFVAFNIAEEMVACTKEALRLLEGGVSCLMKRESEFTFGCPHFLYTYYREPGKLKETADYMASEFPAFPTLASGCGAGCDMVTLAEYALETGDWQAAELHAFKAMYKAKAKEQTGIALCAGLTLIRLYLFQGRTDEGMELLRQLREDVAKESSAIYNTTLELVEGYAYGCLARLDCIPRWLQIGDMSLARFMYQGMAFNYIVYGKAVLLSGNYIQLEVLTEEFGGYFSILQNQLGFLHNQILESAARCRLYGMESGCASLKRALAMAREDHILLPFAEYAPAIIGMLRQIAKDDIRDIYTKEVLEACEQYLENLKRAPQSAASLTEREKEVLILAADGLKRNEVANRLGVSEGTVKTHLQNVYQKLDVNGKTAAIKKAKTLKVF
ncbi:MAG: LuxR C-terminal-related transcriptional regulator [Candidatus Pelethousia sp.]|nr:LuxR C-terminal-related transcriptional regulator [Candidatus Pelethousia sp.]